MKRVNKARTGLATSYMVEAIIRPLRRQAEILWNLPLVQRVQSSKLIRGAVTLAGFSVAGHAITIAFTPLLSRVYTPEDLGAFGLITAFITAVSVASGLNFEPAIPSARDSHEALSILLGAVGISTITSLLFGSIYAALTVWEVGGFALMPVWSAGLVASCLWLAALASALHYWSMRQGDFQIMGSAAISTSASRVAVQLGAGVVGLSWAGLVLGEAAGRVAASLLFIMKQRRSLVAQWSNQSVSTVRSALSRQRVFATVLLPSMLADQILSTVSIPVLTELFGLAVAGHYFFMRRVLDLPLAVIGRTVADAFHHQIATEAQTNPENVRKLLVQVFASVVGISAFAALPIIVSGPAIFALVFGEPWREAGLFAAMTTPALVISMGVNPISRVFAFTRRTGLRYVFTIVNGVGTVSALTAAWFMEMNVRTTVAALSVVSFLSYISYFMAAYVAAGDVATEPRG